MKKVMKDLASSLIEIALIILVFYFLFWPVKIDGASMEDTFHSGDRVAFCKIVALTNQINRNDIVVVKIKEADQDILIIKRVIALPGDSVKIEEGNVYVNNILQNEDYMKGYTYGNVELTVPEKSLYVLGDNRTVSKDSRIFGPVSTGSVQGKVLVRLYPFNGIHFY